MSTLRVINLQNPSSGVINGTLNSDGTSTFGGVINFAAGQVFPLYSGTGAPSSPVVGSTWYDTSVPPGTLKVWDGGAWNAVGGGAGVTTFGGGSTGLLPSAATSGVVTLSGVLNIANGGTGASTLAAFQAAALPTQSAGDAGKVLGTNGSTASWVASGGTGTVTNVTGTAPIVVATGSTTPAISITAATTAATGSIQLATQAEAITGTDAAKASTPATAVAKTTADQTGFVVLPSSATAPATTGYFHYNSTSNHLEYYNGTAGKTAVEREGDNMSGKLSVTPSAITAGAGNWNLAMSNYWTLGAVAVPLPTGMVAGQGGLIQVTAVPTSWPAAGGVLKYAGGTAPAIATVPAIIPYYSNGTNVYLGKATENIS